jgi:hypothetical protein
MLADAFDTTPEQITAWQTAPDSEVPEYVHQACGKLFVELEQSAIAYAQKLYHTVTEAGENPEDVVVTLPFMRSQQDMRDFYHDGEYPFETLNVISARVAHLLEQRGMAVIFEEPYHDMKVFTVIREER